jgi:hypothetical protein
MPRGTYSRHAVGSGLVPRADPPFGRSPLVGLTSALRQNDYSVWRLAGVPFGSAGR